MEIKRESYLKKLSVRKQNGLIKVITGIRRCGKSYLLNELFYKYLLEQGVEKARIIKFAFDSADDLELIGEDYFSLDEKGKKVDPKKFMDYIKTKIVDDGEYYLLLDEIQKLGAFESVLNGYLRKQGIDIYVTGSNSRFLSSDILTEFEGRGDEVHVFPLSFKEFVGAFSGTTEEAFEEYKVFGGLPAILSMRTTEQKSAYLNTQLNNVYVKDIVKRYGLHDEDNVKALLDVLASGISCLTNPTKLEATFRSVKNVSVARKTIDRYIDYFEDAFIVSKALRYDVKGKKYLDTPYKLYFEDVGLRNARLHFRQIEETHIMENMIYNELRKRGFSVDIGIVEAREKDGDKMRRKQYEIDFVANAGSKRYYIQSAYEIPNSEKWVQETRSFGKIGDSFKKIVIVKNPVVTRHTEEGYAIMGVVDFLLNENSLEE